jgi:hypothetical protein
MVDIAQGIEARRAPSVRWVLASLSLSMLLSSLGTSIANVGLPTLAQAFNASFQDVQWVVLSYLLAITTLIVSVGRLGDIIGRRRLLLAGVALFTVASGVSSVAPTLWLLIVARAVQGLGVLRAIVETTDVMIKRQVDTGAGVLDRAIASLADDADGGAPRLVDIGLDVKVPEDFVVPTEDVYLLGSIRTGRSVKRNLGMTRGRYDVTEVGTVTVRDMLEDLAEDQKLVDAMRFCSL